MKEITERNRDELKEYLQSPEKKLQEGVIHASKEKLLMLNQKTVSGVISKLRKEKTGTETLKMLRNQSAWGLSEEDKRLEKIEADIAEEIKYKFRQEGEYLVKNKAKINPLRPLKLKKTVKYCSKVKIDTSLGKENAIGYCESWSPLSLEKINNPKRIIPKV